MPTPSVKRPSSSTARTWPPPGRSPPGGCARSGTSRPSSTCMPGVAVGERADAPTRRTGSGPARRSTGGSGRRSRARSRPAACGEARPARRARAGRTPRRTGSMPIRIRARPRTRRRSRPRLPGPMTDLQDRTRWEPAEAEARIFDRWLESGLFHPEPAGHGGRELLDRDPAAERHRRAAHGPRAQRLRPGLADPLQPHARQADEVDPRHRPRGHRDPDAGRAAAALARARAARRSAARRSSSACGAGARSTAGSSSSSSSASAPRATTRRSASRSTRATCAPC